MATKSKIRSVEKVVDSIHTFEGAGFPIKRPIGIPALQAALPFVMLDHFGKSIFKLSALIYKPPVFRTKISVFLGKRDC